VLFWRMFMILYFKASLPFLRPMTLTFFALGRWVHPNHCLSPGVWPTDVNLVTTIEKLSQDKKMWKEFQSFGYLLQNVITFTLCNNDCVKSLNRLKIRIYFDANLP
jgi:hypothetical protein